MNKEKELQEVRNEIVKLKAKEAQLVQELINEAGSFNDKFQLWMDQGSGQILGDLFALRSKSPLIREYLDRFDSFGRCETIDLCEFMDEDLAYMLEDFEGADQWYDKKAQESIKKVAQEMMKHNIRGVIFDW